MTQQRSVTTAVGDSTRTKLLRKAAELSQTIGYDALSLQELADELGIRKASIFHHFSSKDALACAVIESDMKLFDDWTHTIEHLPPKERLTKYFDHYRSMINHGHVCPGGAFAVSWPMLQGKVRDTLVNMHKQNISFLDELVSDGVADQSFSPLALTSDIIKSIPDMLQGAIQVGRAGASVIPINRIERLTMVLLGL
jgi:TetR/AcrR family transcriptional regulator, transcriptional repressor for nem operon